MKIKKMDQQSTQQQQYNYQQQHNSNSNSNSQSQSNQLHQSSNEKKINIPAFLNKNTNEMRRSSF